MSIRVDTANWVGQGIHVGNPGLGVRGAVIRATTADGLHGPGILYDDWDSSADDDKEFRAWLIAAPSAGTLDLDEAGSLSLTGAPDGSYSLSYRLDVDGVEQGTATETIQVGVQQVQREFTLSYALRAPVQRDFSLAMALRAPVQRDFSLSYGLSGTTSVQRDFGLSYALRTSAHRDFTLSYALQPGQSVQRDFAISYPLRAAVQRSFTMSYQLGDALPLPRRDRWLDIRPDDRVLKIKPH